MRKFNLKNAWTTVLNRHVIHFVNTGDGAGIVIGETQTDRVMLTRVTGEHLPGNFTIVSDFPRPETSEYMEGRDRLEKAIETSSDFLYILNADESVNFISMEIVEFGGKEIPADSLPADMAECLKKYMGEERYSSLMLAEPRLAALVSASCPPPLPRGY